MKRQWDWTRAGFVLTACPPGEPDNRYWVRKTGKTYQCEDSFGGVWGPYDNPLSAMLAIERQWNEAT